MAALGEKEDLLFRSHLPSCLGSNPAASTAGRMKTLHLLSSAATSPSPLLTPSARCRARRRRSSLPAGWEA